MIGEDTIQLEFFGPLPCKMIQLSDDQKKTIEEIRKRNYSDLNAVESRLQKIRNAKITFIQTSLTI